MKYSGVIFDFNGTLFVDEKYNTQAWNEVAMELRGEKISDFELKNKINGVPNVKVVEYLNKDYINLADKISKYKESLYRKYCLEDQENLHLEKGAIEFFEYLQKHQIPFTIATASIKENVDFFIEQFELRNWFDINKIVYDDGSFPNKCNMYKKAATNLQVPIENCLVVEDAFSGATSAHKAGCQQIALINYDNVQQSNQLSFAHKIKGFEDLY